MEAAERAHHEVAEIATTQAVETATMVVADRAIVEDKRKSSEANAARHSHEPYLIAKYWEDESTRDYKDHYKDLIRRAHVDSKISVYRASNDTAWVAIMHLCSLGSNYALTP